MLVEKRWVRVIRMDTEKAAGSGDGFVTVTKKAKKRRAAVERPMETGERPSKRPDFPPLSGDKLMVCKRGCHGWIHQLFLASHAVTDNGSPWCVQQPMAYWLIVLILLGQSHKV